MLGLVPCLYTISWIREGPLQDVISYAYDQIEAARLKAGDKVPVGALTYPPRQADCCWRHLPSLQKHIGHCFHLIKSEKVHLIALDEDKPTCSASPCAFKHSICESIDGKHSRQPDLCDEDEDIWNLELDTPLRGTQSSAIQVVQLSPPRGLSKLCQEDERGLANGPLIIEQFGRRLGTGTYGQVYEANVIGLGRAAAKVLNEETLQEEGNLEQSLADFLMEAELHYRCRHENIVRCYGLASVSPLRKSSQLEPQAMVMELMTPDSTLTNLLRSRKGGLPRQRRFSCALDIARALEHIHSLGIIHFDVKSQNVMVDSPGSCKLTDFGLAFDAQGQPLDFYGRGSVAYMAPEIHDRSRMVDTKVDVFSFGVFMWELMTGREPHHELTYEEIVEGVLHRGLRPALSGDVGVDCSAWVSLMQECWREAPQARPSFTTIVSRLQRCA